jgi:transcriptional regulator with XRE-family HTH domain
MRKRYNDVLEMIKEISADSDFKNLASKEIDEKRISKFLFVLRCKANLTQKQIAEKMDCSQGRISKIESALDREICIRDLLDYAKALNLQLEIGYRHHSMKIVDLIKYHAFKIKQYLNQLTDLAKEDESIKNGIAKFHLEAFINIGKIISDSISKLDILPKKRIHEKTAIHISTPFDFEKKHEMAETK